MSARTDRSAAERTPEDLVFAVCHEVGNLLAAVRLQAHLLDDEQGTKGLARTSIELDDLSARASALLAQVRPLLRHDRDRWVQTAPDRILAAAEAALAGQGMRGVRVIAAPAAADIEPMALDAEALQAILLCQLYAAIDSAASVKGRVGFGLECDAKDRAFFVENDGEADDDLDDWQRAALRGRPLACAVAQHLLAVRGGRVVVLRKKTGERRVELRLPV